MSNTKAPLEQFIIYLQSAIKGRPNLPSGPRRQLHHFSVKSHSLAPSYGHLESVQSQHLTLLKMNNIPKNTDQCTELQENWGL